MLQRLTGADERFAAKCLDPAQRDATLRRELKNLRVLLLTTPVLLGILFIGKWDYLTGASPNPGSTDFLFLCMMIVWASLLMFTHSNIRLLRGLQILEEKLRVQHVSDG
jgi:hypothetical protein